MSGYVTVGHALAFFGPHGGVGAVNGYRHALGVWATDTLARAWGTEPLTDYALCGSMFMLRTPLE